MKKNNLNQDINQSKTDNEELNQDQNIAENEELNIEHTEKITENEADHFNIITILSEQNNSIDKFKIKMLIEIYENTFGHKISPVTENLIIDLVLETEKYIESIMESVK